MCRWLAYSGSPILINQALYMPAHSLVDQSLHSRLGAETTNGDGFGVGWYGDGPIPGVFHSTEPAWNDQNLHELADHISSPLFFTHIRAAIGSAVQQTNCHPFRHENWLFMHNGYINEFATIKRDLVLAIDPSLYPGDPGPDRHGGAVLPRVDVRARGRSAGARSSRRSGLSRRSAAGSASPIPSRARSPPPTARRIWAVRYSSEGKSRSLFYTTDVPTLRELYPDRAALPGGVGRGAADRVRAARRRRRGLERGARVHLGRGRARRRRGAPLPAPSRRRRRWQCLRSASVAVLEECEDRLVEGLGAIRAGLVPRAVDQ